MTKSQSTISSFFEGFPSRSLAKNDTVLKAGQPVEYFYYIQEGAVKMTKTTSSGRQLVLHIFFPGSFLPLLSLISDTHNQYDFTAIIPTTVRVAPKAQVTTFLESDTQVLLDLQERLLKGLAGLLKRIEQQTLTPAQSQVAGLLIYFLKHFSTPDAQPPSQLMIKLTHQEIADWLGLSRENVSIQMKRLEQAGVISTTNHVIKITDLPGLSSIADHETG